MSPFLFAVALLWVAPLLFVSLLGLLAQLSPGVRAWVQGHLFGFEEEERAGARHTPRRRGRALRAVRRAGGRVAERRRIGA